MKRVNHLLEKMTCPDNLRLAFWKAKKGKATSQQVLRYRQRLDTNLRELRHQILLGEVNVGEYFYFKIYDPKEREICASAFSEQVLHHALMNVCHPYFDRVHIFDSYASRPGKGVHLAVKRAAKYTRQWPWYLKMDIRQFFASIDHSILKGQLARLFKEHKLLGIFDQIIDSYHRLGTKGLPIGNLSSQYFANHYLTT
ncbi:MAG: reverse transcriptase, partial [Bacteroidota bacterium]